MYRHVIIVSQLYMLLIELNRRISKYFSNRNNQNDEAENFAFLLYMDHWWFILLPSCSFMFLQEHVY